MKGFNVVYRKQQSQKRNFVSGSTMGTVWLKRSPNPHAIMEVAAISYLMGKR
ncbi:hypothetical protein ACFVRR_03480 [Gottfriedia sp. NPDC057948]|uniref:hypothetical protein n=1 Tax=Gottfriedia sp. NPDC057948 TaxID=3346287 RepID=UPI0036DA80FF